MSEIAPLATLRLRHATMEFWPDCCVSVFPDGLDVPAAPNGVETMIDTACHEWAHSALAQVLHDQPSVCLRAVAEGDGHRWMDDRRAEEGLAYPMGLLLAEFVRAMIRAYGPRHGA